MFLTRFWVVLQMVKCLHKHRLSQWHRCYDVVNTDVRGVNNHGCCLKNIKLVFEVTINIHSGTKWAHTTNPHFVCNTVKPAVAATSIKRDPPLSGLFRAPRTILNANAPLLSVHLSNAASGRRNSPQNAEIVSSNGQFLYVDAASFD